jgi:hypothetical protein
METEKDTNQNTITQMPSSQKIVSVLLHPTNNTSAKIRIFYEEVFGLLQQVHPQTKVRVFSKDCGIQSWVQTEVGRHPNWTYVEVAASDAIYSVAQVLSPDTSLALLFLFLFTDCTRIEHFDAKNAAEEFVTRGGQLMVAGSKPLAEDLGASKWLTFNCTIEDESEEDRDDAIVPDAQDPDAEVSPSKRGKITLPFLQSRMCELFLQNANRVQEQNQSL